MSEIRTFEDLDVWKIGRELSKSVYELTKKPEFGRDYGLRDQIRRAAVSVMSNASEGFERGSNKDFVRFLFIAKGSSGEVRSLLYVAVDQGYISEEEFTQSSSLCIRASKTAWGLIKSLRNRSGWLTGVKITLMMLLGC